MTPNEITALAGPELDRAVHRHIFGAPPGKSPRYSVEETAALMILRSMPLFVARMAPGAAGYREDRPFVAGVLAYEPAVKGDITLLRVVGATLPIALCKAALIAKLAPPQTGARPKSAVGAAMERAQQKVAKKAPQPVAGVRARQNLEPIPKRREPVLKNAPRT